MEKKSRRGKAREQRNRRVVQEMQAILLVQEQRKIVGRNRREALNGRAAEANMLVRNLRNQRKQQKLHHKEMLHHRSILHPVGRNQMPHLEHRQVILNQLEILHPKEPNMEYHQRKFRVVRLRLRK